jgi:hypothetical protein
VKYKSPFARFWEPERGLSAMLVLLAIALFVVAPLVANGVIGPVIFDIFFLLLLLSGVVAIAQKPLLTVGVVAIVVATAVTRAASLLRPGTGFVIAFDALSILALSVFAALVLVQVFREGPVTSNRIQGAIVVYLLLGLIWTSAYEIVNRAAPGAFHFADPLSVRSAAAHGFAYFSFVTLTTVGYGDIVPVHPMARSLAMAEALIGQLYPAVLIARLVALEIESRRRG